MKMLLIVLIFVVLGVFAVRSILTPDTDKMKLSELNFKTLELPLPPNKYLVCPKDYCRAKTDAMSITYDVSVAALKTAWNTMVAQQLRVTLLAAFQNGRQERYIQLSRVFHFPDFITVDFISVDEDHSTLAIYSHSKYGHSDLGVNQQRVQTWLRELQSILEST